jgi:F0F1-type ATP synthase assembly protein I
LRQAENTVKCRIMKLLLAVFAYLLVGVILGGGMLLLMAGKPWLLIVGLLTYIVAFAKIGCLSH